MGILISRRAFGVSALGQFLTLLFLRHRQAAAQSSPPASSAPAAGGWTKLSGNFMEAASAGVTPEMYSAASIMDAYNSMVDGPGEDFFWGGGHNGGGANGPVRWNRAAMKYELMIPHSPLDTQYKSIPGQANMDPSALLTATRAAGMPNAAIPKVGLRACHVYSGNCYIPAVDSYLVLASRTGWIDYGRIMRDGYFAFYIRRNSKRDGKWSWEKAPDFNRIGNDLSYDCFALPDGRVLRLTRAGGNGLLADYLDAVKGAWTAPVQVSGLYMGFGSSVLCTESGQAVAYLLDGGVGIVRVTNLATKPQLTKVAEKCAGMYDGTGLAADSKNPGQLYFYVGTNIVRWNKDQGYRRWRGAPGPKPGSWLGLKGRMTDDGLAIVWHLGSSVGAHRWTVDRDEAHWEPWPAVSTENVQAKINADASGTVQLAPVLYSTGAWINKNLTLKMAAEGTGFNSRVSSTSEPKSFIYVGPPPDDQKRRIAATVTGKILNSDARQGRESSDPTAVVRAEYLFDLIVRGGDLGSADNGLLIGNAWDISGASTLQIIDTLIHDCGGGRWGLAHGCYASQIASALFRRVKVARVGNAGNALKSRAGASTFEDVQILGGPQGNRCLDIPNAGALTIVNGFFRKGATDDHAAFISYGLEHNAKNSDGSPAYPHQWTDNRIVLKGRIAFSSLMPTPTRVLDLPASSDAGAYPTFDASELEYVALIGSGVGLGADANFAGKIPASKRRTYATEAEAKAAGIVIPAG